MAGLGYIELGHKGRLTLFYLSLCLLRLHQSQKLIRVKSQGPQIQNAWDPLAIWLYWNLSLNRFSNNADGWGTICCSPLFFVLVLPEFQLLTIYDSFRASFNFLSSHFNTRWHFSTNFD